MERLGFATGYDPDMSVGDMAMWMASAERAGFDVGLFSETGLGLRDAPTALSVFSAATEAMQLGSAVAIRIRSPVVMAQTIATLDEVSDGRIFMALGACTDGHARAHSLPKVNPVKSLLEYVEVVRRLLAGDCVSYHGDTLQFDSRQLGWKPRRASVPIYIAATSKRGLEIAGAIGDGVLLNAICSPEYTVNALRIVRGAAEEAGRDWERFVTAQIINCSIEDDHQSALDQVRWEVATKLGPQRAFRMKASVGEPHVRVEDLAKYEDAWDRGGKAALMEIIPDSYVESMTASGTSDEVRSRVDEYMSAGLRLPILRPAAAHQVERLLDCFTV